MNLKLSILKLSLCILLPGKNEKVDKYFVEIGSQNKVVRNIDIPVGPTRGQEFENVFLPEVEKLIKEIDITNDSYIHGATSYIFRCALSAIPQK